MIDTKVWVGVQSFLDNYIRPCQDDQVVILYTSDSYESAAWVSAALELREIAVKRVWMAPLRDEKFQERLVEALPSLSGLTRLVILSFERDTMSHTRTLATAISGYGSQCSVFRTISASSSFFSEALLVTPEEISARNTALLERLMPAQHLHITTRGGSNLNVALDAKHRWISNRGTARQKSTVILPAGEVATFPASISGVFVADFAFNVNAITDRDARLSNYPVKVWIENGRAVRYQCDDEATTQFLEECFHTHCAFNVGELGFGTNFGIDKAIPMNSHINERRPGIHIGFGQHNQDASIVCYQCSIHLDLIAEGGMIWIDGDPMPIDLENVDPSSWHHPESTHDEDVFSPEADELDIDDCCGILTSEGLHMFTSSQAS